MSFLFSTSYLEGSANLFMSFVVYCDVSTQRSYHMKFMLILICNILHMFPLSQRYPNICFSNLLIHIHISPDTFSSSTTMVVKLYTCLVLKVNDKLMTINSYISIVSHNTIVLVDFLLSKQFFISMKFPTSLKPQYNWTQIMRQTFIAISFNETALI